MDAEIVDWDEVIPHFDETHLRIRSECGLCCQTIHPDEWAIACEFDQAPQRFLLKMAFSVLLTYLFYLVQC